MSLERTGTRLFRKWSLWFFSTYYCLLVPFCCSFKAPGGVSSFNLYLLSRKSIPFPTNRLPLTPVTLQVHWSHWNGFPPACPWPPKSPPHIIIISSIRDKIKSSFGLENYWKTAVTLCPSESGIQWNGVVKQIELTWGRAWCVHMCIWGWEWCSSIQLKWMKAVLN